MITKMKIAISESGYMQKHIAHKIGLSPGILSRYVSGERKPPKEVLEKLAEFLGVAVHEINQESPAIDSDLVAGTICHI